MEAIILDKKFGCQSRSHPLFHKERDGQRLARNRVVCGAKTPEGIVCIAKAQKRPWVRVKALGLQN